MEQLKQALKLYNSTDDIVLKQYFAFRVLDILYSFHNKDDTKINDKDFEKLFPQNSDVTRAEVNNLRNNMLYKNEFNIDERTIQLINLLLQNPDIKKEVEKSSEILDSELIKKQVDLIKRSVNLITSKKGLMARYNISYQENGDDIYKEITSKLTDEIDSLKLSEDGFELVASSKKKEKLDTQKAKNNLQAFKQQRTTIIHNPPKVTLQKKFSKTLDELQKTIETLDYFKTLEEQVKQEAETIAQQEKIKQEKLQKQQLTTEQEKQEDQKLNKESEKKREKERREPQKQKDKKEAEKLRETLKELNDKLQNTEKQLDDADTELQKILEISQNTQNETIEQKTSRIKQNIERCEEKHIKDQEDISKKISTITQLLNNKGTKQEKETFEFIVDNNLRPELKKMTEARNINQEKVKNAKSLLDSFKDTQSDIASAKIFNVIYSTPTTKTPPQSQTISTNLSKSTTEIYDPLDAFLQNDNQKSSQQSTNLLQELGFGDFNVQSNTDLLQAQQNTLNRIENGEDYADDELNFIIRSSLKGDTQFINTAVTQISEQLEEALRNFAESQNNRLVIPIQVNGNHLTGLLINRDNGVFTATYIDPTGQGRIPRYIAHSLYSIGVPYLKISTTTNIIQPADSSGILTNNHCGAFTGFILSELASGNMRIEQNRLQILNNNDWQDIPDLNSSQSEQLGQAIRNRDASLLRGEDLAINPLDVLRVIITEIINDEHLRLSTKSDLAETTKTYKPNLKQILEHHYQSQSSQEKLQLEELTETITFSEAKSIQESNDILLSPNSKQEQQRSSTKPNTKIHL